MVNGLFHMLGENCKIGINDGCFPMCGMDHLLWLYLCAFSHYLSISLQTFSLSGQQEYSQRQAGIASGIVLAVIIPLVLLFVYIAYKFFEKRQQEKDEEEQDALNYEAKKREAQEIAARKLTAGEHFDDDTASSIVSGGKETTID